MKTDLKEVVVRLCSGDTIQGVPLPDPDGDPNWMMIGDWHVREADISAWRVLPLGREVGDGPG